jgi:2-polyprenyl-6-methoxyphenol hydroxylase-like FAD-dependent oxidoreductase
VTDGAPLKVTIAGGSIGGLCAGIALRGIGADVEIFERSAGPMDARGAGIVVQPQLTSLLREHHAPALRVTSCLVRRYLDPAGGNGRVQPAPQEFTSWEAIYLTLRAAFPNDRYHMGAAVSDIVPQASRVCALIEGRDPVANDVLIAADGANSSLRRRFLPAVAARYAGYVAWRGTLDEWIAPSRLVSFLDNAFTFCEACSGGHMLAYFIPGDEAATEPGRRRINWVWYIGAGEPELARYLTDKEGRRHHASLVQGSASAALIGEICDLAEREVHPIFAELVAATPDPFVQTIVDVIVPQTVFGRVMLLGDAAFVVRPHTAGATAKAAHDAWVLGRNLARARGNIDAGLKAAESLQLEYGNELTNYGIALGGRWANLRAGRKTPGGAA